MPRPRVTIGASGVTAQWLWRARSRDSCGRGEGRRPRLPGRTGAQDPGEGTGRPEMDGCREMDGRLVDSAQRDGEG